MRFSRQVLIFQKNRAQMVKTRYEDDYLRAGKRLYPLRTEDTYQSSDNATDGLLILYDNRYVPLMPEANSQYFPDLMMGKLDLGKLSVGQKGLRVRSIDDYMTFIAYGLIAILGGFVLIRGLLG